MSSSASKSKKYKIIKADTIEDILEAEEDYLNQVGQSQGIQANNPNSE